MGELASAKKLVFFASLCSSRCYLYGGTSLEQGNHSVYRPQKRDCLLGTGTGDGGEERVKARLHLQA